MKKLICFSIFMLNIVSSFSQSGIVAISKKDSTQKIIKESSYVVIENVWDDKWRGHLKVLNDTLIVLKKNFSLKSDTIHIKKIYEVRKEGVVGLVFKGVIIGSVVAGFIAIVKADLGDFVSGSLIAVDGIAGTGGFILGNALDEKYNREKYFLKFQTTPKNFK